eukprot:Colp12_sorted_trinity150504_noHs@18585
MLPRVFARANSVLASHLSTRVAVCSAFSWTQRRIRSFHNSSRAQDKHIDLHYENGVSRISLPLNGKDTTLFILPHNATVGAFLDDIKNENPSVDNLSIFVDGAKVAGSAPFRELLRAPFSVSVDGEKYTVTPPEHAKSEGATLGALEEVINRLLAADSSHVQEVTTQKERELAEARAELAPLESLRNQIDERATRSTKRWLWGGLFFMSAQFGVMWRLTYWEYSWDIVEPLSYFLGFSYLIGGYAWFLLRDREHTHESYRDTKKADIFHKQAKKHGLDLGKYSYLKEKVYMLEDEIHRLKNL